MGEPFQDRRVTMRRLGAAGPALAVWLLILALGASCTKPSAPQPLRQTTDVECEGHACADRATELAETDAALAERYAARGCGLDDGHACAIWTALIQRSGTADRHERSYPIARKGCRLGSGFCCWAAGSLL